MRTIKMYKNRKMYDKVAKSYVTLLDLLLYRERSVPVTIIDHNNNDVTELYMHRAEALQKEREILKRLVSSQPVATVKPNGLLPTGLGGN